MDIEAILKEYTSMMKQKSSLSTLKTFKSEVSAEAASPTKKSTATRRAQLAKK